MDSRTRLLAIAVTLACLAGLHAQAPQDDETAWRAVLAWFKSAPPVRANPFAAYAASLEAAGPRQRGQAPGRRADDADTRALGLGGDLL